MFLNRTKDLLLLIGELIKRNRTLHYDQADFARRVGCSVKTISRMEQGQPVNAETLFQALDLLNLIDDFTLLTEQQLKRVSGNPKRHRTGMSEYEEFPNDF
ncbi:helix-turn-helix domain-containing protein [Aliidiomarina celeris]|uniref:helix-turn-helix domain-containing protein n=1 Tax=Aliidiomarina celeris TaxID=2249428 RepID=UPI000DEB044C|nr:helix-turn-helix transcriptional regulator [Aliidiomarina celeris]